MMIKILITQTLTTALLALTSPFAVCQESLPPEEVVVKRHSTALPSGAIRSPGKPGAASGNLSVEEADEVEVLTAPPEAPRSNRKVRYLSTREDVPPIVVQFSAKAERVGALPEDLAVLTLGIRKALEGAEAEALARPDTAILRGPSNGSVRTIYLDGFGALVFVKAGFPLLGAPAPEQPGSEAGADSEWNRAKQEILAERRKALALDSSPGQPYDSARVETLKTQILSALKEAANVRTIQPTDFVAVTVFGPPTAVSGKAIAADARGTVLTIRVKKTDIDLFAAGKLDAGNFRGMAAITAYFGNGYGVTSLNSWAKGGSGLQLR